MFFIGSIPPNATVQEIFDIALAEKRRRLDRPKFPAKHVPDKHDPLAAAAFLAGVLPATCELPQASTETAQNSQDG
jgi:hypothetical protein